MPTVVQPYPMRWSAVEEGESLRITISIKRSWVVIAFLVLWLSGWTYGGLHLLLQLFTNFQLFGAFFMTGWALVEVLVAWFLMVMVAGKEILTASPQSLEIHWGALGTCFLSKQYAGAEIRDLRFQHERGMGKDHRANRIAFEYGPKTVTFGACLEETEANQLITLIKSRCQTATSAPA